MPVPFRGPGASNRSRWEGHRHRCGPLPYSVVNHL